MGSAAHGHVGTSWWGGGRQEAFQSPPLPRKDSETNFYVLRHTVEGWGTWSHVEVLHGLGDVELVHGGDDDGRGGEEEEEDEEDDIDDQAAQPPDEATDGEVLPGKEGEAVTPGTGCLVGPQRYPGSPSPLFCPLEPTQVPCSLSFAHQ